MSRKAAETGAKAARISVRFHLYETDAPVVFATLKDLDSGDRRRTRFIGLAAIGATLERFALGGTTLRGNDADRSRPGVPAGRSKPNSHASADAVSMMVGVE